MSYRVYAYGVTEISSGREDLFAQHRLRVQYWNALVEVEREYRQAMDGVLSAVSPELAGAVAVVNAADEAVERAYEERNAARVLARSRVVDAVFERAIDGAKSALEAAWKDLSRLRKAAFALSGVQEQLTALDKERRVAHRLARNEAVRGGLHWGSYLDIDLAYNTARRKGGGRRLRLHSTRGPATVGAWFQAGLPVQKAFGADSRLGFVAPDPLAWTSPVRGERRRLSRTEGYIRVGTNADRTPRLVRFKVVLHRPLPEGGILRKAALVADRVGTVPKVRLLLTVRVADSPPRPGEGKPEVGVDLGWRRKKDGGLRVAYAASPDGWREELVLPSDLISAFGKSEDLRSIRDQHFNEARGWLAAWRAVNLAVVPDWWKEATATLAQWKSPGRLAALRWRWVANRFAGDDEAWGVVDLAWRKDRHLWDWEANGRDKATGRRLDLYRHFALRLAERAGAIWIEDFDIRGVIRDEEVLPGTPHARVLAAVSTLRTVLEHTCAREGVPITRVPPQYTTVTCHVCERVVAFDPRLELLADCPFCGAHWDQDYNAAQNLVTIGTGGTGARRP